ncbi:synaptobrevin-domain-containing protein [Trametes maxima]|nr:synaptobrevin-domain-containing protein [Trametes maxima]
MEQGNARRPLHALRGRHRPILTALSLSTGCSALGFRIYARKDSLLITYINVHAQCVAPPSSSACPSAKADSAEERGAKTAVIQDELDETAGLITENIQKVAERGEKLDDLGRKTEQLEVSAKGFRRSARNVRKQMWMKDLKMRIIIGLAITAIIVLLVVSIVRAVHH